ncbi:dihydroflavonol 4-reductase-like [Magnolia sinica]|uniref:dihydroflavonol 4-reductase-like n=1 Tax=Magnolia sinica TaxID=86752 RepID=UPI002658E64B|nr:dihydroflavonol 4-reductase-like [Magnolia sinica]
MGEMKGPVEMGEEMKGPVVVTGAAGFIGSWLVMRLLEKGYTVRATVRDPTNISKTKHLLDLPDAATRLTIWKADLDDEGSFDQAIDGCTAVFHVATPMDFESTDPENEVIKPTINGVLNIMRSCKEATSVKRVFFTSSAGTVNVEEQQKPEYTESSWSDIDFCRRVKMTGWMYFVSKSLAEKAAWDFAKENSIDFISVIPTLVVGPFIMPSMPPSMITALALITGTESHYSILKQIQLVHLDDLCMAHIFLMEHPEAEGRYICSSHDTTIIELAKKLKERYPEYTIPTQFKGVDATIKPVRFSSKKLTDLGFKFQYTMEDMYDGAIQSCREKKLIPLKKEEKPFVSEILNDIEKHVPIATA